MSEQTPKTIAVFATEYYETSITREPVELNLENYPELDGMNEDEIQTYILENGSEMKPMDSNVYESLMEELNNQDTEWDKIDNEDFNIIVE